MTTRRGVVVPASVVQRGPNGPYAFVIKPDGTVEMRPVKVAQTEAGETLLDEGLEAGQRVVVDGQYRLQPGSKVEAQGAPGRTPAGRPANRRRADRGGSANGPARRDNLTPQAP